MSIMSGQKTWLLLGVLAITGGAAFVYFDPFGLDPLGLKSGGSAAKSAAVPNGHTTPAASKAPLSAASAVLPATGVAATLAAPASAVVATSPAPAEVAPPAALGQALQQPSKLSKTAMSASKASESGKTTGRPMIPMDSDLRYCLKLDTDAAIAKCSGE